MSALNARLRAARQARAERKAVRVATDALEHARAARTYAQHTAQEVHTA
ncbi:hypothetical protein [Kocuria sp. WN036]|nr:hypothetical protein [Kocuria sp. WN036]